MTKNDAWVIKTDSQGIEQWSKTFDSGGNDLALSIQKIDDDSYLITGSSWIINIDSNGKKLWSKELNRNYNSIIQTNDGALIGLTSADVYQSPITTKDIVLVKLDEWQKKYGGWNNEDNDRSSIHSGNMPADEYPSYVQETSDGGFIVIGETETRHCYIDESKIGNDNICVIADEAWVIKTNAKGEILWDEKYGGVGNDYFNFIQQTSDNGYIIVGKKSTSNSAYGGPYNAWILKIDSSGNEQWSKTFGGQKDDLFHHVKQTLDDGFIILGDTNSFGTDSVDGWVIKTDQNGNEQWSKTLGGNGDDSIHDVQQISENSYLIAGSTLSYGNGKSDAWLINIIDEDPNNLDSMQEIALEDLSTQNSFAGTGDDSKSSAPDIEIPEEESIPGFEILSAVLSLVTLFYFERGGVRKK